MKENKKDSTTSKRIDKAEKEIFEGVFEEKR